ncbi:hypothetical protein NB696_004038 [Xanthomonas sacchari]|nr:hypothetical protein [Xanthomonas sacchari]
MKIRLKIHLIFQTKNLKSLKLMILFQMEIMNSLKKKLCLMKSQFQKKKIFLLNQLLLTSWIL